MAAQHSEVYGEPLPSELPNLWERFNQSVIDHPESLALVCAHQAPNLYSFPSLPLDQSQYHQNPYLRWSYRTLRAAVDRMVDSLLSNGVREGTPLVTFIPNSVEWVITFLAANCIGCVIAPINPRNLSNTTEITHMLDTVQSVSPEKPIVFVAGSVDIATQIDALAISDATTKIVASPDPSKNWTSFHSLVAYADVIESKVSLSGNFINGDSTRLVLFTSGTTSLPKGCIWTPDAFSCFLATRENIVDAIEHEDKCCLVIPNNHALGCYFLSFSLSHGAAAVYPGPAFAPGQMVSTVFAEQCTHTVLVPTMIHALTTVWTAGQCPGKMKNIVLGGSLATPEALYMCIDKLGTAGVENGYGMTEGLLIFTGNHRDPSKIIHGSDVAVGWAARGTTVKVCAAGQRNPLPRNTPGEIHFSGRSLCKGYIGKATDAFYTDEQGVAWLITGDQGMIDDEGRIFVVGRYKEMIIRGAENISPAAIESVLGRTPRLAALNIQIVGAPDIIAGEIPIAVVQGEVTPEVSAEIQDWVVKQMGTIYAPDETISLQSLGLTEYPKTMAGKIQKSKLAELVGKYLNERDASTSDIASKQLEETVKLIWARAVGRDPKQLSLDSQISDFADSITVMRVRDKIKRETGKTLSLSEMAGAGTLTEQIRLLQSSEANVEAAEVKNLTQREGPPEIEDMVHLIADPELFDATKTLVETVISPFGLSWGNVAEVLPAYDFATILTTTGIFDSWNFKMAILPTKSDKENLLRAFDMMLRVNPMLASFLVCDEKLLESDIALHVIIKHSEKFLLQVVQDGGSLKSLDELKALTLNYPFPKHATFPGPLFRATIYEVEEIESAAAVINVNHAVIDASYGQIFLEDLDRALNATNSKVHDHIDYKFWADSYHSLRSSPSAKAATKWHTKRLKGLRSHQKAIFPPIPDRAPWDPALEAEEEDGFQYSFESPDILRFREAHHNITAPITLKAAMALLNIHRTGHTHALFANLEAARTTFPFVPKIMENQFEATDVAGPTIQAVINIIELKPQESVIEFFYRMQDDQTNLTKHASAPLKDIISALGDDGQMITAIIQSQIFNWVPGMGTTGTNPYTNMELLKAVVRPEVGLAVNAGLGGKESSTIFLHLRGDAADLRAFEAMALDLEKISNWMLTPANWNRHVGNFGECL